MHDYEKKHTCTAITTTGKCLLIMSNLPQNSASLLLTTFCPISSNTCALAPRVSSRNGLTIPPPRIIFKWISFLWSFFKESIYKVIFLTYLSYVSDHFRYRKSTCDKVSFFLKSWEESEGQFFLFILHTQAIRKDQ